MGVFPVRQYQPGGEFVVVRAMDYGERRFEAGEPFPWREMGLHEAVVQMLWKAVRIEVKRAPVEASDAADVEPGSPMEPPAPSSPAKPAAAEHTAAAAAGEGESTAALEHSAAPAVAPPAQLDLGAPSSPTKPAPPSKGAKPSTNPLLGKPLLAKR